MNGTPSLSAFDDFRIISGGDLPETAVTLCAILRNEMYFLEAFLAHYRRLGIERFVLLNDRSDDGSRALLMAQPDVTLVESGWHYGDEVTLSGRLAQAIPSGRILYIWRGLLQQIFAPGRWAVQVDLDEFVTLPPERSFADIFTDLGTAPFHTVWGGMLDVYPADFADLMARRAMPRIDLDAPWYFDAEPHLRLRPEIGEIGRVDIEHPPPDRMEGRRS
ncbi:MAG: glycosyltransferase family 2 protein, partial [Pseudomonadota bacterium]